MPARQLPTCLLLLSLAGSLAAQNPVLQRIIEKGRHPAIRWGQLADVQADASALYRENGWRPLWLARDRPTAPARAMLDALTTAGDRGLDAGDYDAAQLGALAATLVRGGADAEQAGRFDAALTIAALRFVTALARGRLAPRESQAGFHPAGIVRALRATTQPEPILAGLEPSWPHYQSLKRALARYRALSRDSASRLPMPVLRGVREGDRYPGAARLHRLLAALGDLPPVAAVSEGGAVDSIFTPELADGIRRFQLRQGVHVDGRLDQATWRLLMNHLPRRIRQMQLALERWRWLPRDLAGPLLVSLPAMRLHYYVPHGDPELNPLRMSVRTGSGFPSERAVAVESVTVVVLRPDWDRGALGDIRFQVGLPQIYLHGSTPDDGSWARAGDGAPGSIRVADARLLAELLLRNRPGWSLERIREALAGAKPVSIRLSRSVPVLVVYATAVARENGQVFFYSDVSGHDRRLGQQLARGYPY